MEFKKALFTSMAAISLGGVVTPAITNAQNTVSAATVIKELTKNAFIYNSKGKRVKKIKLVKGKWVNILGTKTIKGKKYYRIGKNKYIKVANFKTDNTVLNPTIPETNPNVNTDTNDTTITNNNSNNNNNPVAPSVPNNTTPPSNNSDNTPAPVEPDKPTNGTIATQAERDALKAYLKQLLVATSYNSPTYEKYEMASRDDKEKYHEAFEQARFMSLQDQTTTEELNKAKSDLEKAYNKLDGQYYTLPCSRKAFNQGKYTLTDTDKDNIVKLVTKVTGAIEVKFTGQSIIVYSIDGIYTYKTSVYDYIKYAKQDEPDVPKEPDKPTEPTKPVTPPATQAERDALKEYLKQVNTVTDIYNPTYEKYDMSAYDDKRNFTDKVYVANTALNNTKTTTEELNKAKEDVEKAYSKLDGKYYTLPCSDADYYSGKYKLTDADKDAILKLVNKVNKATDAKFVPSDKYLIKYNNDSVYPSTTNLREYVIFAEK